MSEKTTAKKIIVTFENSLKQSFTCFVECDAKIGASYRATIKNAKVKGVKVAGEKISFKDKAAYSATRKALLTGCKGLDGWPRVDDKPVNEVLARGTKQGDFYNNIQNWVKRQYDAQGVEAGNRVSDSAETRLAKAIAAKVAVLNLDSEVMTLADFVVVLDQVDVFKAHLDKCLERDA
jgi:hypothetical protein